MFYGDTLEYLRLLREYTTELLIQNNDAFYTQAKYDLIKRVVDMMQLINPECFDENLEEGKYKS